MPDITIVVGVLHTVKNLFYGIELVGTEYHEAFVPFMQYDVLADNLAKVTLVEEEGGKLVQLVERNVGGIRPVERELESAIRVVGEISGVHTIGDDKQLDIVEQAMKGCLVVALYLIVSLFQFYTPALQFYLNQRQAVDEYRHVVTAFLSSLNGDLVGNLKLILAPMCPVKKLNPHTLATFQFKRIEVA